MPDPAKPAPIGHNRPPTVYASIACPECGVSFAPAHHRQHFCTEKHRLAYNRRALGRGQAIVVLGQAWRGARGSKGPQTREAARFAFSEMCRLLDQWNTEDREAGRMPAVRVVARRRARDLIGA